MAQDYRSTTGLAAEAASALSNRLLKNTKKELLLHHYRLVQVLLNLAQACVEFLHTSEDVHKLQRCMGLVQSAMQAMHIALRPTLTSKWGVLHRLPSI